MVTFKKKTGKWTGNNPSPLQNFYFPLVIEFSLPHTLVTFQKEAADVRSTLHQYV
jgi:hypothetical protein